MAFVGFLAIFLDLPAEAFLGADFFPPFGADFLPLALGLAGDLALAGDWGLAGEALATGLAALTALGLAALTAFGFAALTAFGFEADFLDYDKRLFTLDLDAAALGIGNRI